MNFLGLHLVSVENAWKSSWCGWFGFTMCVDVSMNEIECAHCSHKFCDIFMSAGVIFTRRNHSSRRVELKLYLLAARYERYRSKKLLAFKPMQQVQVDL